MEYALPTRWSNEAGHLLRRMSFLLAHFRHGAMSDLSPECASNRTSPHRYGAVR